MPNVWPVRPRGIPQGEFPSDTCKPQSYITTPRLDSLGFPLVGGRLDYVDGRNVAVVVYTRRQHVINVFYGPAETAELMKATTANANGYHLIRSRHNGLDVWIVSDLNLRELEGFAGLLETSH